MRKMPLIITLLITLLIPFCQSYAQEETTQEQTLPSESESKYFDLSLQKISQSAFDKSIQYELTITPLIDSPRTQIIWEVPLSFTVRAKHKEFVDLDINQTYTLKANIKPSREGSYDISASVISWQYDTNYTNSISDTVVINNSLLVEPVFTEYTVGRILLIILCLILSGFAIWGGIALTKKGLKKTKKWLTPPI